MRQILSDFNDIACTGIPTREPKHGFEHVIDTTGEPTRLAAAQEYFDQMEAAGMCEHADSPWVSPLHMVVKPDNSLQPCGVLLLQITAFRIDPAHRHVHQASQDHRPRVHARAGGATVA